MPVWEEMDLSIFRWWLRTGVWEDCTWHTVGAQCIPVELNDKSNGPQARELKAITQ